MTVITSQECTFYIGHIEAKATAEQKVNLIKLSPDMIKQKELAGEKITELQTKAPSNGDNYSSLKVITENGWFAVLPLGTENFYKLYAESFLSKDHLKNIIDGAQTIVYAALQTNQTNV